jgi:hypothetical protein
LSGIQEILLIVLIILAIFFVPRMTKSRPSPKPLLLRRSSPTLSGLLRLAIVISILWPVGCALYFKPWHDAFIPFAVVGIGPVVVAWSLNWVMAGMRRKP